MTHCSFSRTALDTRLLAGTVRCTRQFQARVITGTCGCGIRQGSCGPMTSQRSRTFTEQRLSRRGALRAGGLGVAASLGSGGLNRALAQDATPVTTTDRGGAGAGRPRRRGHRALRCAPGDQSPQVLGATGRGTPGVVGRIRCGSRAGHRQRLQGLRPGRVSPSSGGNTGSHGCRSACRATGRADAGGAGSSMRASSRSAPPSSIPQT